MEKFLHRLLIHPALALGLILLISAGFLAAMLGNFRMETNLDKYMPQTHPAFVYSRQAEDIFQITDSILVAVEHPDSIYNPGTLQKVKDLTEALEQFAEVKRGDVTSLYTADNIVGTEDGLDVTAFYNTVPQTPDDIEALRQAVRDNAMVSERIVSADETVTLVAARIADDAFSQDLYQRILALGQSFEGPETVYVAGTPIVEGALASLGPQDMARTAPLVIAVIAIVLFLTLRSVKNTLFTLLVVLFSTIWTFGLMALLNIPIYAVSTMIPVMLIAIGVADGIHLYSHLDLYLRDHPQTDRRDAVADMLHELWKPVVMTSVTTAVGFVALVTSQVYPIKYFGVFTAFGVLAAMVFSLVLIPSGILVFGFPARHQRRRSDPAQPKSASPAYALAEALVKHKYLVFGLTALALALAAFGIPKIWINSSFLENFERDSAIARTDAFVNAHFGGTNSINVILEGREPDAFKQPDALRLMDRVQHEVEQLESVGNSFSLADYLKRMNMVMNANDGAFDTIPDSSDMIAQYLLLYEMSGDPDNLWQVVNYGYQQANVTVQVKSDNSKDLRAVLAVLEDFRPQFEALDITIAYAGSGYTALVFIDLILQGQIVSVLLSLVIVWLLLSLMFKNALVGLIGVIPITLTTLISFGLMGLADIPLSITTALVSSIAIGIGIDYAVHLIERYKLAALATGEKRAAIRLTMYQSGRAILFNAAVVIAGFLVLLFSVFPPNRVLGALVSLDMFLNFVGTVTVMFLALYGSNIYFRQSHT